MVDMKSYRGAARLLAKRHLRRFRDEEDGSLMILSLQIFLIMLITTGIAIDFSRQEERRELIQNTIDRAVLAAASLTQDLDGEAVIRDYLAKAGLGSLEVDPKVTQGQNREWRRATVSVRDTMPTIFGSLIGVDALSANGDSQAEESVGNVEISMVLDVSGSMNTSVTMTGCDADCPTTRLGALQKASKDFVDKMFKTVQPEGAPPGRLSISVVPYSINSYLGPEMQQAYTLSNDYAIIDPSRFVQAQCVDFDADDMAQIEIDGSKTLTRTMYGVSYDYGSSWSSSTSNTPGTAWLNCMNYSANRIIPLSNDRTFLLGTAYPSAPKQADGSDKGYFDRLTALGATATDIGAKWGLALLDPSSQDEMAKISSIDNNLSNRPIDYTGDTMKVMVLMSDGENTDSYSTLTDYRHGPSGIMSTLGTNNLNGMSPGNTSKSGIYFFREERASQPYYRYSDGTWVDRSDITQTTQVADGEETKTATCTKYYSSYSRTWRWNSCSVSTSSCSYNYTYNSTQYWTCSETQTKYRDVVTEAPLYDVNFEYLYQTRNWNLNAVADLLRRPYGRSTIEQYEAMALQSENDFARGLTDKDDRLDNLCTLAKKNGVTIFTVSVDPKTTHEVDVLRDCATTATYAYAVTSNNLSTAFSSIASAITALRLTN